MRTTTFSINLRVPTNELRTRKIENEKSLSLLPFEGTRTQHETVKRCHNHWIFVYGWVRFSVWG